MGVIDNDCAICQSDVFHILDSLCNIFGKAKAPCPDSICMLGLSQLCAMVNVRVTNQRWLQWHVSIDFVKDSHRVIAYT
jgi:hypothetical protein